MLQQSPSLSSAALARPRPLPHATVATTAARCSRLLVLAPPTRRFPELLRRPDAAGRRHLHDCRRRPDAPPTPRSEHRLEKQESYQEVRVPHGEGPTPELVSGGQGKGLALPSSTALSLPGEVRSCDPFCFSGGMKPYQDSHYVFSRRHCGGAVWSS